MRNNGSLTGIGRNTEINRQARGIGIGCDGRGSNANRSAVRPNHQFVFLIGIQRCRVTECEFAAGKRDCQCVAGNRAGCARARNIGRVIGGERFDRSLTKIEQSRLERKVLDDRLAAFKNRDSRARALLDRTNKVKALTGVHPDIEQICAILCCRVTGEGTKVCLTDDRRSIVTKFDFVHVLEVEDASNGVNDQVMTDVCQNILTVFNLVIGRLRSRNNVIVKILDTCAFDIRNAFTKNDIDQCRIILGLFDSKRNFAERIVARFFLGALLQFLVDRIELSRRAAANNLAALIFLNFQEAFGRACFSLSLHHQLRSELQTIRAGSVVVVETVCILKKSRISKRIDDFFVDVEANNNFIGLIVVLRNDDKVIGEVDEMTALVEDTIATTKTIGIAERRKRSRRNSDRVDQIAAFIFDAKVFTRDEDLLTAVRRGHVDDVKRVQVRRLTFETDRNGCDLCLDTRNEAHGKTPVVLRHDNGLSVGVVVKQLDIF
ncbi:hypothetical protein SmphiM12_133 [Sinorhizobium phage phiM12]|uniref:Uncharacterized protein n=1 Tax=Sinorhizobium phage phiM12 TaxID=1357423 RepID=S5MPK8_9CAUD|nr:hypothetical protein AB690_gp103 [Sinorhizobium phage phiM12]AGR47765.1 hypothetical protein SmphiM12_133 [Sinorhizobium phage phiM12]